MVGFFNLIIHFFLKKFIIKLKKLTFIKLIISYRDKEKVIMIKQKSS